MFQYSHETEDNDHGTYTGAIRTEVLYLDVEGNYWLPDSSAEGFISDFRLSESRQERIAENQPAKYNLHKYLSNEDKIIFQEHLIKCSAAKNGVTSTLDFRLPDGSVKKVQMTSFPGSHCLHTSGFLTILHDLSIYQSLKDLAIRIEELNLVGKIAGSVAHEVRNPLTVVRGHLQLLSWDKALTPYYEQFESMIAEVDRAVEILNELLYMSRPREPRLERQNLNEILNKLYELLNAEALVNQHEVVYELEDVPDVNLDKKRFRQIVLNLVNNGLQAMDNHNRIIIRTYARDGKVYFAVQDHGKGIPPEVLKKLGTPFVSTKANGTGLGLVSCYSIVAEHKAEMEVETGPGGTTFTIIFDEAV